MVDVANFTFPRHYMTNMAISGQKGECAVLVFGREGHKCHTIYGDIMMEDLRFPSMKELSSIRDRSRGLALTEIDEAALSKNESSPLC